MTAIFAGTEHSFIALLKRRMHRGAARKPGGAQSRESATMGERHVSGA
jgi:hypothetical protein